jgi:hypothetical protein
MLSLVLGAVLFGGCSESSVSTVKPDNDPPSPNIVVTPPVLEFGQLMSGELQVQTFNVRNVGEAPLTVDDITVELSDAFTILSPTGFFLETDASVDIEVEFTPRGVENVGQAVVWSDDPDERESLVDLLGFGSVPELQITPDPYDFGTHFVPCGDWTTLQLENVGGDLLVIDGIQHVSDGDFVLDDPNVFPVELLPGQYTSVNLTFAASRVAQVTGELQVTSNDPRGLVTSTQTGAGQFAATASDQFVVPSDPPVDIMFAVDQSCSMDDDSAQLGANFDQFINAIDTVTQGWQIGVANVSTGCFNNGILSANSIGYQAAFASAVVEGTDSTGDDTWSEKLLHLGSIALGKTTPGQCNSGFLRPGALLHIIYVSDEPERSPNPWSFYRPIYEQYVADPSLLKVSVVIDQGGCGQGATGYPVAANSTGGVILDLCGDWANQIGLLGAASLQDVNTFPLSNQAVVDSIEVRVDGNVVTTGWTFNPTTSSIVFDTAPAENAVIDVDYGVAVSCQP